MPKRKTYEQFVKDVYDRLGPTYKILDTEYPGSHGKVYLLHHTCGNKFYKNVHDIITKNSGCPYCNGCKPALYNKDWVIANTPKDYQYIDGYKNMSEKCLFHCNKCGTDFLQSPSRLINEHIYGCNCCPTKKKTHDEFIEELGEATLKEYEILSTYINADTKIKIKHKSCNAEFEISPDKFLHRYNKKYCPICYYKKSHGEIEINKYLIENNILYYKEFSFPDLKQYKFDFFLPEYNLAIEFDGAQHFMANNFFGGEEGFKNTQRRDQEKNIYCLNNNIALFRIPYTEINNIPKILYEILQEKSSTTIEKFLVKNEVE